MLDILKNQAYTFDGHKDARGAKAEIERKL